MDYAVEGPKDNINEITRNVIKHSFNESSDWHIEWSIGYPLNDQKNDGAILVFASIGETSFSFSTTATLMCEFTPKTSTIDIRLPCSPQGAHTQHCSPTRNCGTRCEANQHKTCCV